MPELTDALRGRDRNGFVAGGLLAISLAAVSVLRAHNHWAGGLDLGLFDQSVWLMSKGSAPDVTFLQGSIFADHVSAVLLLFVPLYLITATPVWLLVGQAVAIGATIVPVRRMARCLGAPGWIATFATVASAPLLAAAVFDFHPLVLAVPGVAWLLVGALEDDRRTALLAVAWIAFCRADAGFVAVGVAILASTHLRWRLIAAGLTSAAAGLAIPHLFGEPRQTFGRYYSDLGDSPVDALIHPWRVASAMVDGSFSSTLIIWLLPVLFLPVLRPRWAAALVVGGSPLLLSSWPGISLPWFHNASVIAPVAIGGALASIAGLRDDSHRRLAVVSLCAGTVVALAMQSPLAPRAPIAVRIPDVLRTNGARVDETIALVSDDVSVAAPNQFAALLAHRRVVYVLPCPFPSLIDDEDDEGIIDICDGRTARPELVLAETFRSEGLRALGYDVEPAPTPGIVVGRRQP